MKEIEFFQKGFIDSYQKTLAGVSEAATFAKRIAEMKRKAAVKGLVGREFECLELLHPGEYEYNKFAGQKFKAVCVSSTNEDYMIEQFISNNGYDRTIFSITAVFLRDPKPILESKVQLTASEKEVLRAFKPLYDVEDGRDVYDFESTCEKLDNLDCRLRNMKHEYRMVIHITWRFKFNDVTADDFLDRGLRARKAIL